MTIWTSINTIPGVTSSNMTSAILKKVVFFIALQIFSPQNRRTRNKIFPVTISNILMIVPLYIRFSSLIKVYTNNPSISRSKAMLSSQLIETYCLFYPCGHFSSHTFCSCVLSPFSTTNLFNLHRQRNLASGSLVLIIAYTGGVQHSLGSKD